MLSLPTTTVSVVSTLPPPQPKTLATPTAIEWESTISIAITVDEFKANTIDTLSFLQQSPMQALLTTNNVSTVAVDTIPTASPPSIDVLFLYRNGVRLSGRQLQRKVTTNCRNLLSFYHNYWYAIKRTTATETLVGNNDREVNSIEIEKIIFRCTTYEHNGLRVSYNCEETNHGFKYNVEYEIEYPANSSYTEILAAERKLMRLIHQNVKHRLVEREKLTLETIFSCVMSKVQMWHCFDPKQQYMWAYKWNGVKAKMLITSTQLSDADNKPNNVGYLTYLWPDANNVETVQCHGPPSIVGAMQNLCLLVELLDDQIIVIEAIGALINGVIYTTEPATNVAILQYFRKKQKHHGTDSNPLRLGAKPMRFQEFFDSQLPQSYNMDLHDGFVICQNDIIIKWKIPTIDVKCVAPYTFTVAGNTINTMDIHNNNIDDASSVSTDTVIMGEVGKIYELSHKHEILRQRNDRIAPSTEQEYKIFLESSKNLL